MFPEPQHFRFVALLMSDTQASKHLFFFSPKPQMTTFAIDQSCTIENQCILKYTLLKKTNKNQNIEGVAFPRV